MQFDWAQFQQRLQALQFQRSDFRARKRHGELHAKLLVDSHSWVSGPRIEPPISAQAPLAWRAPEGPAAVPVGGGGAWPGFEMTHQAEAAGVEGTGGHDHCARGRRRSLAGQHTATSRAGVEGAGGHDHCARGRRRSLARQHTDTPTDWRPPRGLQGLAGLRDDAPSEARCADGSRAGRPRGGRRSVGATSNKAPPVWRAPEGTTTAPVGGGGAWPGNTQQQAAPVRRALEGPATVPVGGGGAWPGFEPTRRAKLAARTASGRAGRAAAGNLSGQQATPQIRRKTDTTQHRGAGPQARAPGATTQTQLRSTCVPCRSAHAARRSRRSSRSPRLRRRAGPRR